MRYLFGLPLVALPPALAAASAHAQTKLTLPWPSPAVKVRAAFSTSFLEVSYSRLLLKGRIACGGLVPHGQVWRTGANPATKICLGEAVKVGG